MLVIRMLLWYYCTMSRRRDPRSRQMYRSPRTFFCLLTYTASYF